MHIVNHDEFGNEVKFVISETDYFVIRSISLLKERVEENRIPTLKEALHLVYFRGMCINYTKAALKKVEDYPAK